MKITPKFSIIFMTIVSDYVAYSSPLLSLRTPTESSATPIDEYPCPGNLIELNASLCYITSQTTCPFHLPLPFDRYKTISTSFFILNITKESPVEYYQWKEIQGNYGKLFIENAPSISNESNITYVIAEKDSEKHTNFNYLITDNITDYQYSCVYDSFRNQPEMTYCQLYDEICRNNSNYRDASNCHCRNRTMAHFCELKCDDKTTYNETVCSDCQWIINEYKEPNIFLIFNYDISVIYVYVKSFLRLLPVKNDYKISYGDSSTTAASTTTMSGSSRKNMNNALVYCYTDADHTLHDVTYRYDPSKNFTIYGSPQYTDVYYKICPINGSIGHYWCEGFKFLNDTVVEIRSGRIIASKDDGKSFTLNITVEEEEERIYPLIIHEETQELIENIIFNDSSKIITSVRFLHLYQRNKTTNLTTLAYRLYLNDTNLTMIEVLDYTLNLFMDYNVSVSPSYCLPDVTTIDNETLTWEQTLLGVTTVPKELCLKEDSKPVTRTCLGEYLYGTYWSEPDGVCSNNTGSQHTELLHNIIHEFNITDELIKQMKEISGREKRSFIGVDVYFLSKIFEQIASLEEDYNVTKLVEVASDIMEIDRSVLTDAQVNLKLNSTDMLLYNLDRVLGDRAHNSNTVHFKTNNIFIQVSKILSDVIGAAFYKIDGSIEIRPLENENFDLENLKVAVLVNKKTLQNAVTVENTNPTLVITTYRHDALFSPKPEQPVTGFLVAFFITGFRVPFLSDEVKILIKPDRKYRAVLSFQHWDYGRDALWYNRLGIWGNVSAVEMYSTKHEILLLRTTTYGNFGVFVGDQLDVVLSVVAAVGCGLSMLGSTVVIVTGVIFKNWRENSGTKVLLNFVLTNLVQNIVLSLSSAIDSYKHAQACIVVGALLHYCAISQFTWMIFIGYLQYQRYVRVFYRVGNRFILVSSVIAWILPIIPVTTVLLIDNTYYVHDEYCYLKDTPLFYGVFVPIAFTLIVNFTIFFIIIHTIYCQEENITALRDNISWLNLRLIILLFFLLGLYWVFGIIARFTRLTAFEYFFCISASLQGLVMFIYFIVFNKMTRNFWFQQLKRVETISVMQLWLQQKRKIGRIKIDRSRTKLIKTKSRKSLEETSSDKKLT